MVLIDGVRLWSRVAGRGTPVVFLPGAGAFGLDMLRAADGVASTAKSVLYDRAGTGFSDDILLPRPLSAVTDELRALLDRLGIQGPFVLVGHSLGGAYAQHFAAQHPDETAGLVLLDPVVRDWNREMPEDLRIGPGASLSYSIDDIDIAAEHAWLERELALLPQGVRGPLIARHLDADRVLTGMREAGDFVELIAGLTARPHVPTIVLHATAIDPLQALYRSAQSLDQQRAAMRRLYRALIDDPARYLPIPAATHSALATGFPDEIVAAVDEILHTDA